MRVTRLLLVAAAGCCVAGAECDLNSVVGVVQSNVSPEVSAGAPQTVTGGDPVYLKGSLTGNVRTVDDPLPTFVWTQLEGPAVAIQNPDSLDRASFVAPVADADEVLVFQITATTASGAVVSDNVTITVSSTRVGNRPPIANAGSSQTVTSGTLVTLDASGSYDVDGGALTYSWLQVEGPTVELFHAGETYAQFAAPDVPSTTRLKFQVTVKDADGSVGTAEVTVIVSR